jgi:hypothetical protein
MMLMKKMLFPLTLILALVLAACGSASTSSASTGSSSSGSGNAGSANQTLSKPAQLLVGTLKLEGTANAVDATEAASLLPLWQAYSQLINSNTAAQAEIDAVVAQIQDAMTKDQVQAITAMKLTRQDEMTLMGSLGMAPGMGGSGASSTPNASSGVAGGGFPGGGATGAGGPPAAGAPGAGGPSAGGGDPGFGGGFAGGQPRSTQVGTQTAPRVNSGGINPMLLNALIDLLQKRAGS